MQASSRIGPTARKLPSTIPFDRLLNRLNLLSFQDGYDEKKIKSVARKTFKSCKTELTGINICAGEVSKAGDCFKNKLMDIYSDNAVWFAKKCNGLLDAVAKQEFQDKVESAFNEKIQSFPKN